MPRINIETKYKIGDVLNVKEKEQEGYKIPAGKYVIHLITLSVGLPSMNETNDIEYWLENLDNADRDWSFNERDLENEFQTDNTGNIFELTGEEVVEYYVTYLDLETQQEEHDLIYVLKGTEPSVEYFNKRIESQCSFKDDSISKHPVKTISWDYIGDVKDEEDE